MKLSEFIGEKVIYDKEGQDILGSKSGNLQKLLDLRGWGAIQNLFKHPNGRVDLENAEKFHDALGEWIVKAINEKIERDKGNDKYKIGTTVRFKEFIGIPPESQMEKTPWVIDYIGTVENCIIIKSKDELFQAVIIESDPIENTLEIIS